MSAGKRGREPGFQMGSEHRVKIRNSNILNALIEHVEGKREMGATQVTAGLGLLRKVMPDLSHSEVEATVRTSLEDLVMGSLAERAKDERDGAVH